jgi:uncharacterized damage-inducible protein DinB
MATNSATRASELASRLETVNQEIIDAVAACSDEQWQRVTASEKWPVGVVAHHVSEVQRFFTGVLASLADSAASPMSLTSLDIDENNAAHARQYAAVGKAETLKALRDNGAALTRQISSLDDARLGQPAVSIDGQMLSGEQVVEFGVVNHFQEHLAAIRATIDG